MFGVELSLEKCPERHITCGDKNVHRSSSGTGIRQ
jgi:hypothetical protein